MDETRVVITVEGGIAEVYDRPDDVQVTIVDFDNLKDFGIDKQVGGMLARGDIESVDQVINAIIFDGEAEAVRIAKG